VTTEPDGPRPVAPLPPGPTARTLEPIPGRDLDPVDEDPPLVEWTIRRVTAAAWAWRWWERFRDGRGTLSAKGIAFYSFFGVLSGLAIAFAIASNLPQYEEALIEVLDEALPGLVGPNGLDPQQLASIGTTVGWIGAGVLVYSAVSIVRAVDDGIRLVYGVQYEPRNFAIKNLRFLGYLLLLTPLVGLSYVGSSATAGAFEPLLDSLGIAGPVATVIVAAAGLATGILLNTVVIMILISRLGGVQPRHWRWRTSLVGGVALEVVKLGATYFVGFTISNPRYLSFGIPVAMLLLFYGMAAIVLLAAALVATANEPDPVTAARRQQDSPATDARQGDPAAARRNRSRTASTRAPDDGGTASTRESPRASASRRAE
jgi:membrane protein